MKAHILQALCMLIQVFLPKAFMWILLFCSAYCHYTFVPSKKENKMVRVMIVDNEATFRKGLKAILLNIGDVDIVGEASNGEEFLDLMKTKAADIVFMDIKMPVMDGMEATRKAKQLYPETTIIAFSSHEHPDYVNSMMRAGANGYLSKSGDNYDVLTYILNNPKAGVFPELNKKV